MKQKPQKGENMKHIFTITICTVLIVVGINLYSEPVSAKSEILSFPSIGLRLTKPLEWHVAKKSEVLSSRSSIRLDDKKLEQLLRKVPSPDVVTLFRYPTTPKEGWNPSIQISFRPYDSRYGSPKDILSGARTQISRATKNLETIDDIQETEVSELKATYMKIAYTVDRSV